MDKIDERDIMDRDAVLEKARDRAVGYLNRRPCTKKQIIRYLTDRGFDRDVALEAAAELESYHYIDDLEYCRMYFQYGFEKGRGVGRIRRELAEKGVESDIIDIAYEELEEIPDQFEAALAIGETMVAGIDTDDLDFDAKRRLQAKIGRRLAGRGFSMDIVYKVINRLV